MPVPEHSGIINLGGAEEVIDVGAGKIKPEIAIEVDVFIVELQAFQVGLVHRSEEIEYGRFFAEIDQPVELHAYIGIAGHQFAVEEALGHCALYLYILVIIIVENDAANGAVEVGLHVCFGKTASLNRTVEGNIAQLVVVEKTAQVETGGGQFAGIAGNAF